MEQKVKLIDELTQKLVLLEEQRDVLDARANMLAEERNKANERVRNLRAEIQELRNRRDIANEKVKELKQRRIGLESRVREKIEEIKRVSVEREILAQKKPSRGHKSLQQEVESIDWKIQTTPLTLQEDKELVEKVRQLETQLNVHKKLEQSRKRILDLRSKVKDLRIESQEFHEQLTALARESQQIHSNMLTKVEESKKAIEEADGLHVQFLQEKVKTKPLRDQMAAISSEIRCLKDEIREEEKTEKKKSEDALRQTIEMRAKEKVKRGEKLSWEEFQLLAEKGETT